MIHFIDYNSLIDRKYSISEKVSSSHHLQSESARKHFFRRAHAAAKCDRPATFHHKEDFFPQTM